MIEVFCDGSCLGNHTNGDRRGGAGYVVVQDGERVAAESESISDADPMTNNLAEYEAVLAGLRWCEENAPDEPIRVYTDSNLVVNQSKARWACNEDHLATRCIDVRQLLGDEDDIVHKMDAPELDMAHDLAQSGAGRTQSRSSGSSNSTSRSTTPVEVPDPLDETPGPFEQPHEGIDPDGIPDGLKRRQQWVNWTAEYLDGRETKVPRQPEAPSYRARSNDADTWSDIGTAISSVGRDVIGLGYVIASQDPYVALDFDDCRNLETFEIDEWVMDILHELDTYAHVSTSNTGVHAFVKADGVPNAWTNKKGDQGHDRELEVYDGGRFMAFTGHRLDSMPREIAEVEDFGEWLLNTEDELW